MMIEKEAVVFNLCQVTELRKHKLHVKILHALKEFEKDFVFCNNLGLYLFYFQK